MKPEVNDRKLGPKHLALLRIHDACQGLSLDEIEDIAANVDVVHAGAGETVHLAGQTIDAIYFVVEGRLRVTLKAPDGSRRTLRYVAAGDQIGALMLVTEDDFPLDVIVDEKAVLLRLQKKLAEELA